MILGSSPIRSLKDVTLTRKNRGEREREREAAN